MSVVTETTTGLGRDYHVFEAQGMKLLFSIDRSRVVRLMDDRLFDILAEYEGAPEGSVDELVSRRGWPAEVQRETLEALEEIAPHTKRTPGLKPYVPDVGQIATENIRAAGMFLMVSGTCNLRCKYCYTGLQVDKHAPQLMADQVAEKAIDWLCRHLPDTQKQARLVFFGGEPLLNFPVVQSTIAYARQRLKQCGRTVRFCLTTNGTLLDRERVQYLHDHGCSVMVSLDGPAHVHDANRVFPDGTGSHAIITKNLRLLREITGSLAIRATRVAGSGPVEELADYFRALGVTQPVTFGPAMPTEDNQASSGVRRTAEQLKEQVTAAFPLAEQVYRELVEGRQPTFDGIVKPMFSFNMSRPLTYHHICTAFTSCIAVGPDGVMYPCHRFWPMPGYELGDVWSGIDIERYRRLMGRYHDAVTRHCAGCWARFLCLGGCRRWSATSGGGFATRPAYECESNRRQWEYLAGYFFRMAKEHPEVLHRLIGATSGADSSMKTDTQEIPWTRAQEGCGAVGRVD